MITLRKETKSHWNIILHLGDDSLGSVPAIILGSYHRFSQNKFLTTGATLLKKDTRVNPEIVFQRENSNEGAIMSFFRNKKDSYISITNEVFLNEISFSTWVSGLINQAKEDDKFSIYSTILAGDYKYFTYKIPHPHLKNIEDSRVYHRFLKNHLVMNKNGDVVFTIHDPTIREENKEVIFCGKANYNGDIIQIFLQEKVNNKNCLPRYLAIQLYVLEESLKNTTIISHIFGVSLWKDSYLEGKTIVLIPAKNIKNKDGEEVLDKETGIYNLGNLSGSAYSDIQDIDRLYGGVLSYLRGNINRYLYTPKKGAEGLFRPHQEKHRKLHFSYAYYLASYKPSSIEYTNTIELQLELNKWRIKIQNSIYESYIHGYACEYFAGYKVADYIDMLSQDSIELTGEMSSQYRDVITELKIILKEHEELKRHMGVGGILKEFKPYAINYWSFLEENIKQLPIFSD